MSEIRRASLVRPTLQTRYHVDFNWWSENDRDWRVYMWNILCPVHQKMFSDARSQELIDWVDPVTAEVKRVDGLQHALTTHCAKQPGFFGEQSALVDAVFRLFVANGNAPMTPVELAERLGRQPNTILNTLSGGRVYKGIRPVME